uniref:Uncharacterized protein n=1 Tax=Glossina austeni TaxID=7395 RepID=A0A1A9VRC3_GLOAU
MKRDNTSATLFLAGPFTLMEDNKYCSSLSGENETTQLFEEKKNSVKKQKGQTLTLQQNALMTPEQDTKLLMPTLNVEDKKVNEDCQKTPPSTPAKRANFTCSTLVQQTDGGVCNTTDIQIMTSAKEIKDSEKSKSLSPEKKKEVLTLEKETNSLTSAGRSLREDVKYLSKTSPIPNQNENKPSSRRETQENVLEKDEHCPLAQGTNTSHEDVQSIKNDKMQRNKDKKTLNENSNEETIENGDDVSSREESLNKDHLKFENEKSKIGKDSTKISAENSTIYVHKGKKLVDSLVKSPTEKNEKKSMPSECLLNQIMKTEENLPTDHGVSNPGVTTTHIENVKEKYTEADENEIESENNENFSLTVKGVLDHIKNGLENISEDLLVANRMNDKRDKETIVKVIPNPQPAVSDGKCVNNDDSPNNSVNKNLKSAVEAACSPVNGKRVECLEVRRGSEGDEALQNIEDIEIPDEDDEEEMILPHESIGITKSVDDKDNQGVVTEAATKNDVQDIDDDNLLETIRTHIIDYGNQKSGEATNERIKASTAAQESDVISLEEGSNDSQEHNLNNSHEDPLNCLDNEASTKDSQAVKTFVNKIESINLIVEDDDDEDEVQIIENRNSPICIESDDDDDDDELEENGRLKEQAPTIRRSPSKQIIMTPTATVSVSKNITITRTNARKSTARQQFPSKSKIMATTLPATATARTGSAQNKTKLTFRSLPQRSATPISNESNVAVLDTIDLLDSSDDEEQTRLFVKKRTLLTTNNKVQGQIPMSNMTSALPLSNQFQRNLRSKAISRPLLKPTPQSNFLNAVQLQPTAAFGVQPAAFSALLSNKNVIIPNAFYGNPPGLRSPSPDEQASKENSIRWLKHFVLQFSNAQLIASHSCFVLLQRVLRYKDFMRIKALRANLNTQAHTAKDYIETTLLKELTTIFFKSSLNGGVTTCGKRFSELTCVGSDGGINRKPVTLLTHAANGRATLKTWHFNSDIEDIALPSAGINVESCAKVVNPVTSTLTTATANRKRHTNDDDDEDEYVPSQPIYMENPSQENNGEERKRSLRTKRTKRYDSNFSYNEDLIEFDMDNDNYDNEATQLLEERQAKAQAEAEIQQKIEQKRLEAKRQREQQVKSFESAFIQTFAKNIDEGAKMEESSNGQEKAISKRVCLNNDDSTAPAGQYATVNDAEDLLQATWIENIENSETNGVINDEERKTKNVNDVNYDDEYNDPEQLLQHYICTSTSSSTSQYSKKYQKSKNGKKNSSLKQQSTKFDFEQLRQPRCTEDEFIPIDGWPNDEATAATSSRWPKNTDIDMHVNGRNKDVCVICKLNALRIVQHYVNWHPGCEIYTSRLTFSRILQLQHTNLNLATVSTYKKGKHQYEATCAFCSKRSRFMLLYWYHHFTMHTGEYTYRCTGCGIRKPTRSLISLISHHKQSCPGNIVQEHVFDQKATQIEAFYCSLCNYVQLHRTNIVKHLHTQHNIKKILPKHVQKIILLRAHRSHAATANLKSLHTSQVEYITDDDETQNDAGYKEDRSDNQQEVDDEAENYASISSSSQSQNQYYNYMPPYILQTEQLPQWDTTMMDDGDDLSYTICGMLDVQMPTGL